MYKNTKEEVGDNKLKNDNNNDKDKYIDLEIKTSGAHFKFDENGKLSKKEIGSVKGEKYDTCDDSTKTKFKTLISKTIINYLLNRNTNYNEIDLILFDNQNKLNPKGAFVLRLNKKSDKNTVTDLVNKLKEIIEIDDSFSNSDDFDIRYDNTKKSIVVRLSSSKYNSKHIFKETLTDDEMDSMIQNFFNGESEHLVPDEKKRKHISDNDGKWPIFRMKFIKAAIDNGWSRVKITNVNGTKAFEKSMTKKFEEVFKYINNLKNENLKNFDIIKFIWDENSDYIKSKDIKPIDIKDNMLEDFIRGEGTGIDKLIQLMIDKEVDFSELIFGKDRSTAIENLKVKRNLPTEDAVIKFINGYCSDNLETNKKKKQGKRLFISWLTKNSKDIKNNGLLSNLKTEENNLNKKESYHIQTFDEMFND